MTFRAGLLGKGVIRLIKRELPSEKAAGIVHSEIDRRPREGPACPNSQSRCGTKLPPSGGGVWGSAGPCKLDRRWCSMGPGYYYRDGGAIIFLRLARVAALPLGVQATLSGPSRKSLSPHLFCGYRRLLTRVGNITRRQRGVYLCYRGIILVKLWALL